VGARIGGYEVVRRLGTGGMGSVYLARHPNLPKDVALKVLGPAYAPSPEFRVRFAREAELLSRLDHPNVAGVRDRGEDQGVVFMVMDLVPGPDLDAVLAAQGPLRPERAVAVVEGVAAGLDHAHDQGLVHRDVKPANVLLRDEGTPSERAVVTDFGIARDLAAAGLTRTGEAVLTYAYAAPEQLSGVPVDRRVDVYALGAVLFELLTGRRAFDAADPLVLTYAALHGPVPDPRGLRPDLPPALAEVCVRAMAKDPGARFATAGALADAARAALQRAPETIVGTTRAPPPPEPAAGTSPEPARALPSGVRGRELAAEAGRERPRRRRRTTVLAALALVLAAAGGIGWVVWSGSDGASGTGTAASPTASVGTSAGGGDGASGETAGGGPAAPPPAPAVGTCLDAGGAATSCDVAHAAEVIATDGTCDVEVLLAHLGGVAGEDVLRSSVAPVTRTVGGAPVCVVDVPADASPSPARDVLLGSTDDAWRRCGDQAGREVSCGAPHTTEVVAEAAAGETLDCRARAGAYLGRPFDQVDAELRFLPEDTGCVVEVRGENVLVGSLRGLGADALPIEAAG
jgi:protein kinase-like protein